MTRTERRIRKGRGVASALLLALELVACSDEPAPTLRIAYGADLLDMQVSDRWTLESSDDAEDVYVHRDFFDLRLHVTGHVEEFGQPLGVRNVKSIIGRELNLEHGGVTARVSLGGNALLSLARQEVDEYDEPVHVEHWVIARPVGHGDVARVELQLRMPEERRADPKLAPIVDALDRRIGDAKIPRV